MNNESGNHPERQGNFERASSRPGDDNESLHHQDEMKPHPFDGVRSYITLKVSRTTIDAPPCRTGQPLAFATASSSESALMTE
jgi:hypothetical protein